MDKLTVKQTLAALVGERQRKQFTTVMFSQQHGKAMVAQLEKLRDTWNAMPGPGAAEPFGKDAVARMHYHLGNAEWWVVERGTGPDNEGKVEAYGIADLGLGTRQCGYIDIASMLELDPELDLFYQPQTVGEIMNCRPN